MNCNKCEGVITEFKEIAGEKYCFVCSKQAQDKEDRKVYLESMPKVVEDKKDIISNKNEDIEKDISFNEMISPFRDMVKNNFEHDLFNRVNNYFPEGSTPKIDFSSVSLKDIKVSKNSYNLDADVIESLKKYKDIVDVDNFIWDNYLLNKFPGEQNFMIATNDNYGNEKIEAPIDEHIFSGLKSYMIPAKEFDEKTITIDGIEYYRIGVGVYFIPLKNCNKTEVLKGEIYSISFSDMSLNEATYTIINIDTYFIPAENIFKDYESAIREAQRRNKSNE